MDSSNASSAKQGFAELTDAEAEAVLVALGPQLEWDIYQGNDGADFVAQIEHECFYIVTLAAEANEVTKAAGLGESSDPAAWCVEHHGETFFRHGNFNSSETAKAACERHYATGEWE